MKNFFKLYGKYFIWFFGAAVIFYMLLDRGSILDKFAASQVAAKEAAKARAEEKQRADYYAKENAKLVAENSVIAENIDIITASNSKYRSETKQYQAKIALMQKCEDARIALDFELSNCLAKSEKMSNDYVLQIDNLNANHTEQMILKGREITELIGQKTDEQNNRIAAQAQMALNRAKFKRRAIILAGAGVAAWIILSSLLGR